MMETTLRTWEQLEASGASCILDLAATASGKLAVLFHCTDGNAMVTYWLASPENLLQLITSMMV